MFDCFHEMCGPIWLISGVFERGHLVVVMVFFLRPLHTIKRIKIEHKIASGRFLTRPGAWPGQYPVDRLFHVILDGHRC